MKVDSTLQLLYNKDDTLVELWAYCETELGTETMYTMKTTRIDEVYIPD